VRVQIWSYNYDPEPQGIGPLSTILAQGLQARGHEVVVVAAHPHYPEPRWGSRLWPYWNRTDGIPILRLPLWIGRGTPLARVRQELTFTAAQTAVAPLLPNADVIVAVCPSFPALLPVMAISAARKTPWVMWLQDIVTDGAKTTAQMSDGPLLHAAQWFERRAYRSANRVVAISDAFRRNLMHKGVAAAKVEVIFNPSTRLADESNDIGALQQRPPTLLAMGNIGHSQGLDRVVESFEASEKLRELGARLVIAGSGVAEESARAAVKSANVEMPGVLYGDELTPLLRSTSLGVVSQRPDLLEFNLPSKLMNYMAFGIPVLASVDPASETARVVRESGAGWIADAADPDAFAATAVSALRDLGALRDAGLAGFAYAQNQFSPATVVERFEQVLFGVARAPTA
jgi:colanic acid biosynthesis glycosyl transferase WcaI